MSNKTIQDFSSNTTPNGNELFLMMLSGVTMNMSLDTIKTFNIGGLVEVFVTGGTYSNGSTTFTNNTGGTFTISGFYTGSTDDNTYVTGGTYSNGVATFTNNTGGTFSVNGFFTGSTDDNTYVTGGTYTAGTATYTNNTGGTFSVSGFSNISDSTYAVFSGLSAQGTTSATTAIANYGVNVFSIITNSDYAAKLPQPVTGKSVKIINMTNGVLVLFPSNVGGRINNNPINEPAQIPPDGKLYEFICIENPLPGAWTWSPPAIGQYDSGEISFSGSGTYGYVIMAANPTNVIERDGFASSTSWGYDGKNLALAQTLGPYYGNEYEVCFKDSIKWNGISKIKVYTNLGGGYDSGWYGIFGLTSGGMVSNYDPADTTYTGIDSLTNYAAGNYGPPYYGNLDKIVGGVPLSSLTYSTNAGDDGTIWGEIVYNGANTFGYSEIGDTFIGNITNPYTAPPATVDSWRSRYLGFGISVWGNPNIPVPNLKFRFIIEYF